jgi:large subunit ribosomal protein L9
MKVILTKDVAKLGKANDIVEVKDGYAKNLLIKNKQAVAYTPKGAKIRKTVIDAKEQAELQNIYAANTLKGQLEALNLRFHLNTRGQKEFGQISNKEILTSIKEHKFAITKQMLDSKNPKQYGIGNHTLKINLYKGVVAVLKITVSTKNA